LQDRALRAGMWRYNDNCGSNQSCKTGNDVHLTVSPSLTIAIIASSLSQKHDRFDHVDGPLPSD
jgi:hypothetical protein